DWNGKNLASSETSGRGREDEADNLLKPDISGPGFRIESVRVLWVNRHVPNKCVAVVSVGGTCGVVDHAGIDRVPTARFAFVGALEDAGTVSPRIDCGRAVRRLPRVNRQTLNRRTPRIEDCAPIAASAVALEPETTRRPDVKRGRCRRGINCQSEDIGELESGVGGAPAVTRVRALEDAIASCPRIEDARRGGINRKGADTRDGQASVG